MGAYDYAVVILYFVAVILIGLRTSKSVHTSNDFFLSGRSLPAWITGLAFMAANLGSFELMGFAANGAKYGMFTKFVLGVFTHVDGTAAFFGMLSGIVTTIGNFLLYHYGYLHYGSDLAMDFDGAAAGFFANVLVAVSLTMVRGSAVESPVKLWLRSDVRSRQQPWYRTPEALAVLSATLMIVMNVIFW